MKSYYPAVVEKEPDSDYGVYFPDLPGCISAGSTAEEALVMGAEALTAHIAWLVREGDDVPAPTALERLHIDSDINVVCLSLVPVTLPGRAKRINVTLDENLIAEIDAVSSNRSGFLAEAARGELARRRPPDSLASAHARSKPAGGRTVTADSRHKKAKGSGRSKRPA